MVRLCQTRRYSHQTIFGCFIERGDYFWWIEIGKLSIICRIIIDSKFLSSQDSYGNYDFLGQRSDEYDSEDEDENEVEWDFVFPKPCHLKLSFVYPRQIVPYNYHLNNLESF